MVNTEENGFLKFKPIQLAVVLVEHAEHAKYFWSREVQFIHSAGSLSFSTCVASQRKFIQEVDIFSVASGPDLKSPWTRLSNQSC